MRKKLRDIYPKKNFYLDLHNTIVEKDLKKIKEPLKNKMLFNEQNKNIPLHLATMNKNVSILKLLKKHNVDPNLKNSHGSTALHIAAYKKNNLKKLKILLNMGAKPNKTDKYGNTPLHVATYTHGDVNIIKTLLEAGANPNAINNDFETPLSIAKNNNRNKCIPLLDYYGAKFQNTILKVLKLSFKTTPVSKKIILMSFCTIILSTAITISILTSGKGFITILFALLASLGMLIVCLEEQYHKIRELEKNTMNKTTKQNAMLSTKKKTNLLFTR